MKQTFSQLIQTSKDYCVDDRTSTDSYLSSTESFIKNEINNTIFEIANFFQMFKTQPLPKTCSTVATQTYYQYPIGINTIQTATITINDRPVPMTIVNSQEQWDDLQMAVNQPSFNPLYIFPRKYDFGIFPVPQDVYTVTLTGNYYPVNLTNLDYTSGTIATTINSAALVGTDTVWTSDMAGRQFAITNGGVPSSQFYVISTFTSAVSMTLQNVWQNPNTSGKNYVIAETPDVPDEVQQFIPFRVAEVYSLTRRRDSAMARAYANRFWTGDPQNDNRNLGVNGGVIGTRRRYQLMGRSNSQIVNQGISSNNYDIFNPDYVTLS